MTGLSDFFTASRNRFPYLDANIMVDVPMLRTAEEAKCGYLCATRSSGEEIDLRPDTCQGVPDILIDDRLVLEVKVNPNKAERDRLLGQCAGYSREWVTWVVLIDTPSYRVRELEELLAAKGLEHILVFAFS
jgi:hypothetical protein